MNDIMNLFSLNGKNAVVTGANTGLGQGICVALAAAGAHVFGVADETAAKIAAEGGQFTEVRADLSDFAAIDSILEQVHAHADRIDILVNNAGIIKRCDAIDVTPENWDAVDFLNEKMVFFLSQAVAKQWVADKKGGKIINIASMLSFQGGIRVPAYTSSKSAVMGMTKALANEWAKYGINVNSIAPGYMATNNTNQLRQDEDRSEEILARIPAGRWGTPADVGGAAIFVFVVISCWGTCNGLTMAVTRGMFDLAVESGSPKLAMFKNVDANTNMANNSAVFGLLVSSLWLLYFYGGTIMGGFGPFKFDSSELPIITLYAIYIPIYIALLKRKDLSGFRGKVMPVLAILCSLFMVFAAIYSHKWNVLYYLIVFFVIEVIGAFFKSGRKA